MRRRRNGKVRRLLAAALSAVMLIPSVTFDVREGMAEENTAYDMDFSSCELLIGTDDISVFTEETEVVSGFENVYLTRFPTPEAARQAYIYYSPRVDFAAPNISFSISEKGSAEENAEGAEENDAVEEIPGNEGPADMSGINGGNDSIAVLNELAEELETGGRSGGKGVIALIDTGVNDSGTIDAVSLIDNSLRDLHGHGTRMYGYIREEYPEAKVLSIKTMDAGGRGRASDVYAAIRYAMLYGADVIDLSISAYCTADNAVIRAVIEDAVKAGIRVVGAAGNNGNNAGYYIPGGIDQAIIAGACDDQGNRLPSSNFGETVDHYIVAGSTSEAAARLAAMIAGNRELTQENGVYSISCDDAGDPAEEDDGDFIVEYRGNNSVDETVRSNTDTDTRTLDHDGVSYKVPSFFNIYVSVTGHLERGTGFLGTANGSHSVNGYYNIGGTHTFPASTLYGAAALDNLGPYFSTSGLSIRSTGYIKSLLGYDLVLADYDSSLSPSGFWCGDSEKNAYYDCYLTTTVSYITDKRYINDDGTYLYVPYRTSTNIHFNYESGHHFQRIEGVVYIKVPKKFPKPYYVAFKKTDGNGLLMNRVSFDVQVSFAGEKSADAVRTQAVYTGAVYDYVNDSLSSFSAADRGYGIIYLGSYTDDTAPVKAVIRENWNEDNAYGGEAVRIYEDGKTENVSCNDFQPDSRSVTFTTFYESAEAAKKAVTDGFTWKNIENPPPGDIWFAISKEDTEDFALNGVTFSMSVDGGTAVTIETGKKYDCTTGKLTGIGNKGVALVYLGAFDEGTGPKKAVVTENWTGKGTAHKGSISNTVSADEYLPSTQSKIITTFYGTAEEAIAAAGDNTFINTRNNPGEYYVAIRKVDEKGYSMKNVTFDLSVTGIWDGTDKKETRRFTVSDSDGKRSGLFTGWYYDTTKGTYTEYAQADRYGVAAAYLGSFREAPTVNVIENWDYGSSRENPHPVILYDSDNKPVDQVDYPETYVNSNKKKTVTPFESEADALGSAGSFTFTNYRTEHEEPNMKLWYMVIRKYAVDEATGETYPMNNVPFSIVTKYSDQEYAYRARKDGDPNEYVKYNETADMAVGRYVNDNNLSGVVTGFFTDLTDGTHVNIKRYESDTKKAREFQKLNDTRLEQEYSKEGYAFSERMGNIEPGDGFAVVYLGQFYYKPDVYIAENWTSGGKMADLVKGTEVIDGVTYYKVDEVSSSDLNVPVQSADTVADIVKTAVQSEETYGVTKWYPMGDGDNQDFWNYNNPDLGMNGKLLVQGAVNARQLFSGGVTSDYGAIITETNASMGSEIGYYYKAVNNHSSNIVYISMEKSSGSEYSPNMEGIQYGLYFHRTDEDMLLATFTMDGEGKVKSIVPNKDATDQTVYITENFRKNRWAFSSGYMDYALREYFDEYTVKKTETNVPDSDWSAIADGAANGTIGYTIYAGSGSNLIQREYTVLRSKAAETALSITEGKDYGKIRTDCIGFAGVERVDGVLCAKFRTSGLLKHRVGETRRDGWDRYYTAEESLAEGTFVLKELSSNDRYEENEGEFVLPEIGFLDRDMHSGSVHGNTISEVIDVHGQQTQVIDITGEDTDVLIDTAYPMWFAAVRKNDDSGKPMNGVSFDLNVNGIPAGSIRTGYIFNYDKAVNGSKSALKSISTYNASTKETLTDKVVFSCTDGGKPLLNDKGEEYSIRLGRRDGVALIYLGISKEAPAVTVRENWDGTGQLVSGSVKGVTDFVKVNSVNYGKDRNVYTLRVSDNISDTAVTEPETVQNIFSGSICVEKSLLPASVSDASPAGAEYTVNADEGQGFSYSGKCVISADGRSNVLTGLKSGRYTVKETKAPDEGEWNLDPNEYHVEIAADGETASVTSTELTKASNATVRSADTHVQYYFYLSIRKNSSDEYEPSMEDIQYGLYYKKAGDADLVATITLGADGRVSSVRKNPLWKNEVYKYIGVVTGENDGQLYINIQSDGSVSTIPAGTFKIRETSLGKNKNYSRNTSTSDIPSLPKETYVMVTSAEAPALVDPPEYGSIQVKKTLIPVNVPGASPAGAVYTVTAAKGQDFTYSGTCTIRDDGTSNVLDKLRPGKYIVKETAAPLKDRDEWNLDPKEYQIEIIPDGKKVTVNSEVSKAARYVTVESADIHKPVDFFVSIRKGSTDEDYIPSMEGIRYGLYYGNGTDTEPAAVYTLREDGTAADVVISDSWSNPVYTLKGKLTKDGTVYLNIQSDGSVKTIPEGTFYLKEIETNGNYEMNERTGNIPALEKDAYRLVSVNDTDVLKDRPVRAFVKLVKTSADTSVTEGNANYSLEGAKYRLYCDREAAEEALDKKDYSGSIGAFTTKEDGTADLIDVSTWMKGVDSRTFYVIESEAAKNYLRSTEVKAVEVKSSNTREDPAVFEVKDVPVTIPLKLMIEKLDALTGSGNTAAGKSLEGAEFTLSYYADDISSISSAHNAEPVTGTVAVQRNAEGRYFADHDTVLPIGYLTVRETRLPEEYSAEGSRWYIGRKTQDVASAVSLVLYGTYGNDNASFTPAVYEPGDAASAEELEEKGIRLNDGLYVKLAAENTPLRGDISLIKKDLESGRAMEGVEFEIKNKATGETRIMITDAEGKATTKTEHYTENSVWFSKGDKQDITAKDGYGALPLGTYIVTEKRGDANRGCQMNAPYTVTLDKEHREANLVTAMVEEDGKYYFYNVPYPVIHTTAQAVSTASKTMPQDGNPQTVTDAVAYKHLRENTVYTIVGSLMVIDHRNGTVYPYEKADGSGYEIRKTFKTEAGYKKSVYEKEGTEILEFTGIETAGYEGCSFMVFERLFYGTDTETPAQYEDIGDSDIFPVRHEDINDRDQTVETADIHTNAEVSETKQHIGRAEGKVTIVDHVAYSGLSAGETYTVTGDLHVTGYSRKDAEGNEISNAAGDEPLKDADGNVIRSERTFTVDGAGVPGAGVIDLVFEIDADLLQGESVVVYEELYHKDICIASHADLRDEDETVHFPNIRTILYREGTGAWAEDSDETDVTRYTTADESAKEIMAAENAVVVDRIKYHNLITGHKYIARGILMDKATGEALTDAKGNKVTVEKEFETPVSVRINATSWPNSTRYICEDGTVLNMAADHGDHLADGIVEAEFPEFDAGMLGGHTAVAFEEIYMITDSGEEIKVAEHKDINDIDQTVRFVKIGTQAVVDDTGTQLLSAGGETTIIDTVEYHNLKPGREYSLKAELMVVNDISGFYGDGDKLVDTNGEPVSKTITFIPVNSDGMVEVPITFSGYITQEMDVVAFEEMQNDKGITIAVHNDLTDKDQTVYKAWIGTTATVDGQHFVMGDGKVTIEDVVEYHNLIPGLTYRLTGTPVRKSNGEALKKDGSDMIENTVFVPEEMDGTVTVTFEGIDAGGLRGDDIVVFERLTVAAGTGADGTETETKEILIAEHEDIDDRGQTVSFPDMHTSLYREDAREWMNEDAGKEVQAGKKTVLVDRVDYRHLKGDGKYILKGTLMDKESGEPAKDASGQIITVSKSFTPAGEEFTDGYEEIRFSFDSAGLKGHTLVAFEELYMVSDEEEKLVAEHKDPEDRDQSVRIVDIGTAAAVSQTGNKLINASGESTIIDTVEYSNLKPGCKYTLSAELKVTGDETGRYKDGETFKDSNGNAVSASVSFTPEEKNGKIEVPISFSGYVNGSMNLVVFEELKNDKGLITAVHEDLNDEKQTCYMAYIGTTATVDGKHVVEEDKTVTLEDEVVYHNLISGISYRLEGRLIRKSDGLDFMSDGRAVTAAMIFVPGESDGSIVMSFPEFDTDDLQDEELVAYEKLFILTEDDRAAKVPVAYHEDINDAGQTVRFEPRKVSPATKETEDTEIITESTSEVITESTTETVTDSTTENDTEKETETTEETPTGEKGEKKPPRTPKTGDDTPILPLMILLAVSFAGMAAVVVKKKRRK